MRRSYRHLNKTDRVRIETLKQQGFDVIAIAKTLNVHHSTIYRELKRGAYYKRNTDYTEIMVYSSDLAQQRHEFAVTTRGAPFKLKNDWEFIRYIELMIGEKGYSPEAALAFIKNHDEIRFKTSICITTLYKYIDLDLFSNISNKSLPVKTNKKRRHKRIRRNKVLYGQSIERREYSIMSREEFGHWEMDTVKSARGKKGCLLVLTERKTRAEIIRKLDNCTSECVINALNGLERFWGSLFKEVFKTITCDNGTEFAKNALMCHSIINEGQERTFIYYCHPYSSYERGSNEVANRFIRRKYPKRTDFGKVSIDEVLELEKWINTYPRKMFGYKTSEELFNREIFHLLL